MQELGIVFHVIERLENMKQAGRISQVSKVTLEIGKVSGLFPDYLLDTWKWANKKSPLLKDAELVIQEVEAVSACRNCKTDFSPLEYGTVCPRCGSEETDLITGNEMNIKEIEAC